MKDEAPIRRLCLMYISRINKYQEFINQESVKGSVQLIYLAVIAQLVRA